MLSLLLAAALGGQPACQAATGFGYVRNYVATPYATQGYNQQYAAPTYQNRIVTAFVPIYQQERYEIVGDAARQQAFAQARLAADTELANAIKGVTTTLGQFAAQVKQATATQDQAFQAQRQPPPPVQYQAQPPPQSPPPPSKSPPPDYGQVPPPPVASLQSPTKGFPATPTPNAPPPPTDASQDQQGTFPTQPGGPTQPAPFQAPQASGGPLSPAMQAATQVTSVKCGSCHTGPNGSGGFAVLASKDRLASYAPDFLRMLDQVAYRGYVLKPDGTKLKMPPGGRGLSAEEYARVHAAYDEADQASTLASNAGGR